MTPSLTEPEQITVLARRHIDICDSIFAAATATVDTETAAHAARSALSVALGCAINLGAVPERETAMLWYGRLSTLYVDNAPTQDYLAKTLRWATDAMAYVFGAGTKDIHNIKVEVTSAPQSAHISQSAAYDNQTSSPDSPHKT